MRILSWVVGVVGVALGAFAILMVYGFASMVDPDLSEAERRAQTLRGMLGQGGGMLALGVVTIVCGIALLVATEREARGRRRDVDPGADFGLGWLRSKRDRL